MYITASPDKTNIPVVSAQQPKVCVCGATISQYDIKCSNCLAKERYIPINVKWEKLISDMRQFNPHYRLEYRKEEIIGIIRENPFDNVYAKIYRRNIYGSGKYALRITTNAWHKANRLKKDFDAKDIAKTLHKRCSDILGKMTDEITLQQARERKRKETSEKLKNEFSTIKNYSNNTDTIINLKHTKIYTNINTTTLGDGTTEEKFIGTVTMNYSRNFSLKECKELIDKLYNMFGDLHTEKCCSLILCKEFNLDDTKIIVSTIENMLA